MAYLDFELEIASGNGSEYPVAVVHSVAGEAHDTMHFPFDEQTWANQLLTLQRVLSGASAQKIDSVSDNTYTGASGIGLGAETAKNPTEVAFRNVKVWTW